MDEAELHVKSLLGRLEDAVVSLIDSRKAAEIPDLHRHPPTKLRRLSRIVEPEYSALAEQMYYERRKRDQIFKTPNLFGEPAWDILLDLLIAKGRGKKLSVSAVCQGSGVAASTGLRYITALEKMSLIERSQDDNDARRFWLRLSDEGLRLMVRFFDAASGHRDGVTRNAVLDQKPVNLFSA